PLSSSVLSSLDFFFFQAEDGIRDGHVTGVQTCALPISRPFRKPLPGVARLGRALLCGRVCRFGGVLRHPKYSDAIESLGEAALRSEERRVGKECRSRLWTAQ